MRCCCGARRLRSDRRCWAVGREEKQTPPRRGWSDKDWRLQALIMAFSYYGFVAGAGAVEGFVCGDAFIFDPGRADPVVVGACSVVLAPGTLARSLAKSSQAPMAMSAAMISSGSTFQSPSSVRVARSQAVLLRGAPSRSVGGSSLVGGEIISGSLIHLTLFQPLTGIAHCCYPAAPRLTLPLQDARSSRLPARRLRSSGLGRKT